MKYHPVFIYITMIFVLFFPILSCSSGEGRSRVELSEKNIRKTDDRPAPEPEMEPDTVGMLSAKTRMIEAEIFNLTNRTRGEAGLKPLERDPLLDEIARNHSIDMIRRDFFDHVNPDGKTPTDRAREMNYRLKRFIDDRTYIEEISENIGKMPTGFVVLRGFVEDTPEGIAKALMEGWMVRQGHRANILKYFSIRIGIGVAFDGKYYVATQNFH